MATEKSLQILETIKSLTILELADLVRQLKKNSAYPQQLP